MTWQQHERAPHNFRNPIPGVHVSRDLRKLQFSTLAAAMVLDEEALVLLWDGDRIAFRPVDVDHRHGYALAHNWRIGVVGMPGVHLPPRVQAVPGLGCQPGRWSDRRCTGGNPMMREPKYLENAGMRGLGTCSNCKALGVDQPDHTAAQDVATLRECFYRLRTYRRAA